ncbi:MAG: manganese efflux pump [Clostridia bacterium]|nr:manganese efflux pump [Clostridia bacterium]
MNISEMLLLSAALSIDALGIGISCALRGIRTPLISKMVIALISAAVTAAAVFIGDVLGTIIPETAGSLLGTVMLTALGLYIVIGAIREKHKPVEEEKGKGINVIAKILRKPDSCDINCSKIVELTEACYIGAAISADSFAAGIGAGVGGGEVLIPVFCGLFQFGSLWLGELIGSSLSKVEKIDKMYFSVLSGIILIAIGTLK